MCSERGGQNGEDEDDHDYEDEDDHDYEDEDEDDYDHDYEDDYDYDPEDDAVGAATEPGNALLDRVAAMLHRLGARR